ncbi:MAG: hypothetical protein JW973_00955 [Bacteroidales bacterium]|nr:hypothetical protein [Bacteroidales bacterium]
MKKRKLLYGLGILSLTALLNSCGDETTGLAPEITFDDSEITLAEGVTTAVLTGKIVAEEKLDQVNVFKVAGMAENQIKTYTSFNSGDVTTTDDLNYTFRIEVSGVTEDISVKIEAIDKESQSSTKSIAVKVTASPALKAEFTAILMGAQSSTYGSCLDANTGTVYKISGDQAKNNATLIDILYYYGSTNQATLAAPNDPTVNGVSQDFDWTSTWSVQNATKFGTSSLDYSTVTPTQVNAISGLSATKLTSLSVGSVVEFQTADNKKGILKVTALETGASGTITLSVKVQE